ncbi:MAG TPA: tetratricopeptide repeat protein, partial [Ktedonobacteraceae bacterium]
MESRERGSFGDLLRAFRQRRRIGQQELGAMLAVHRNTIGAWERGERLPETRGLVVEIGRRLRLDEREMRQLLEASLTALSPYWNVPYQRNPFFTGREQILEQLHKGLSQSQAHSTTQSYALSGLGGIGKTQTAIEYAYRYYPEYNAVFWLNADSEAHLISSIVSLGEVLDLPEVQKEDQSRIITVVLQWLNNHRGWLLIADNVEDITLLQNYLPTARQGALLLTTRRQEIGTIAPCIEVPVMSHEEGIQFLLRRTKLFSPHASNETNLYASDPAIRGIVEVMDGLPLALDQAGAYIRATQCTLLDYLQRFWSSQQRLLDEYEDSSDHPMSVARTVALVFEQVEQNNTAAAEFLTVCAFLAPDAIPDMFFSEGAAYLGPTLAPLASDLFQFDVAIRALLTYSLIQRHAAAHTVTIHRLVQAVLKGRLSEADQRIWATRVLHAMTQLFHPLGKLHGKVQADYWLTYERLLPHALECIAWSKQWGKDEALSRVTLMSRVATYLRQRARFAEAESLFLQALCLQEQALEAHHLLVTETLNGLAVLYRSQGKYQQAEPLFQQVLRQREQLLGSEHPLVAEALNGLAILYAEQGKCGEAEPLFERALHIREQALGSEHPLVATCLNNLAYTYRDQKRYEE